MALGSIQLIKNGKKLALIDFGDTTDVAFALKAAGYSPVPIPEGGKSTPNKKHHPNLKPLMNWTQFGETRASDEEIRRWGEEYPGCGYGVTGYKLLIFDTDSKDPYAVAEAEAVLFEVCGATPAIRSGHPVHRSYFFRRVGEIKSTSFNIRNGHVDILAKGKQSVVYGCYPGDGKRIYRFVGRGGRGLCEIPLGSLPTITQEQVNEIKRRLAVGSSSRLPDMGQKRPNALVKVNLLERIPKRLLLELELCPPKGFRSDYQIGKFIQLARYLTRDEIYTVARQYPDGFATKCVGQSDSWVYDRIDEAIAKTTGNSKVARSQGASGGIPQLTTRSMAEITRKPVPWVWDPYFVRGNITIFEGDPGAGKSTLMVTLGVCMVDGRMMVNGKYCEQEPVIYFTMEDDPDFCVIAKVEDAGCINKKDFHICDQSANFSPNGLLAIEQLIEAIKPGLVIFDTLFHYIGQDTDTRSASAMAESMIDLHCLLS